MRAKRSDATDKHVGQSVRGGVRDMQRCDSARPAGLCQTYTQQRNTNANANANTNDMSCTPEYALCRYRCARGHSEPPRRDGGLLPPSCMLTCGRVRCVTSLCCTMPLCCAMPLLHCTPVDSGAQAKSGMYTMRPKTLGGQKFKVYCKNDVAQGGWSLIAKIGPGNWKRLSNTEYGHTHAHVHGARARVPAQTQSLALIP